MKMDMPPSGSYQTLALAWQPSGNEIVGVVKDENKDETVLYKWYTASGDIAKEYKLAVNAFDATWDPDGKTVAVALQNGSLMLISADVFTPKRFLSVNPTCKLNVVMWGGEKQKDEVVTAGNDTLIYTLNVTSGLVNKTPNAHTDIIKRLVLSPNGTMYASGGFDNLVKIWGESHPHVVWHSPVNGAKGVSVKANITIKFDRKMVESILSTSIRLYTAQINVVVKNNNTMAVIEPQGELTYEATYNVIVAASAKGLVGGNMTSDYSFTFKTEVKPSGPALDIPWLWVGVAALVIFVIIIIAVLARRRRTGKRIMPQRRRSEDERR
jgi:WD40 repeat protein